MLRTQETLTSKTSVRMCAYPHTPFSSRLQLFTSLCLLYPPSSLLLLLCFAFKLYHILPSFYALYRFSWKLIKSPLSLQISIPAISSFLFSLSLLFCLWAHKDYLTDTTIHLSWRAWERLSWMLLRGCALVCARQTPLALHRLIPQPANLWPHDLSFPADTELSSFLWDLHSHRHEWFLSYLVQYGLPASHISEFIFKQTYKVQFIFSPAFAAQTSPQLQWPSILDFTNDKNNYVVTVTSPIGLWTAVLKAWF